MIQLPLLYLLTLALIAASFYLLESKTKQKVFQFIPAVVMIYALSMLLASLGLFEQNSEIKTIYKQAKTNLLPAMLFLMLLQVDLRHFLKIGNSLLVAYILAVLSIAFSFVVVSYLFHFSCDMSAAFGALAGSWMGGTANMIAVGSALDVSEGSFAYALVVDSVNYTLWVMLLLFLVPFAHIFNKYTKSDAKMSRSSEIACSCTIGAKRYWLLVLLALLASFFSQYLSTVFTLLSKTTTMVLVATLLGVLGSFTRLGELNGSAQLANSMLYLIIALIGSQAVIRNFQGVGEYVVAGFTILLMHAILMIIGAKIFKLDLFSVSVASLANIGGVASAPILAAAYDKSLVSVGVLMAIMGYIIGTFGGLIVGNILIMLH